METQIATLEELIKKNLAKYSGLRSYMYKKVKRYKFVLIILSTASTIILGLEIEKGVEIQKNLALVVSAIITAITTFITFWNFEEYWIQNKVMEQKLELLSDKFKIEKSKGFTADSLKALQDELINTISSHSSYWKDVMENTDDN